MQPVCRFTCSPLLAFLAVLILATGAAGQSEIQSYDTGIVRGTVEIRLENGRSEQAHRILIVANGRTGSLRTQTDRGRFEFRGLAPGTWYFRAQARGLCQREDGVAQVGRERIQYVRPYPMVLMPCREPDYRPRSAPPQEQAPQPPPPPETLRIVAAEKGSGLAVSPDGRMLASANGNVVTVRLVGGLRQLGSLAHDAVVVGLTFSPHGSYLCASTEKGAVVLWNPHNGQRLGVVYHRAGVTAAIISPDERFLATATHDNVVRLWEAPAGRYLAGVSAGVRITALAFGGDASHLVAEGDGRIQLLSWEPPGR